MRNGFRCSSYSTRAEVCINVSRGFNSTQYDKLRTYFVKNKLEAIRRLASWLIFCQYYEGSTSREGGYVINNGVCRSAAGMSRRFDPSNLLLGGIKFLLQYINIGCRLLNICYINRPYFYKSMQLLYISMIVL